MSDEITYVKWFPVDHLPDEERMKRVEQGHHHDFWGELVECDEKGVPLVRD